MSLSSLRARSSKMGSPLRQSMTAPEVLSSCAASSSAVSDRRLLPFWPTAVLASTSATLALASLQRPRSATTRSSTSCNSAPPATAAADPSAGRRASAAASHSSREEANLNTSSLSLSEAFQAPLGGNVAKPGATPHSKAPGALQMLRGRAARGCSSRNGGTIDAGGPPGRTLRQTSSTSLSVHQLKALLKSKMTASTCEPATPAFSADQPSPPPNLASSAGSKVPRKVRPRATSWSSTKPGTSAPPSPPAAPPAAACPESCTETSKSMVNSSKTTTLHSRLPKFPAEPNCKSPQARRWLVL
mmetsp:Transcript_9238/g.23756  ORF Transcript_9238/g.23756 Transcript_9238/m.23756 type:complete len:302 (+) Transcript_9238:941-1846(+)